MWRLKTEDRRQKTISAMYESLGIVEFPSWTAPEEACPYLPLRASRMTWRMAGGITSQQYQRHLERGWRRFGAVMFRPACQGCRECRSLRLNVHEFTPSKSQRRTVRRNADVRVSVQPATVSRRHLELFNAYHADMHLRRGWQHETIGEIEYVSSFLSGGADFAMEFRYEKDGKLIGVGLVDVLRDALSSVYFYHDPAWRAAGPGTFSILSEIEIARSSGRTHYYLGYWIAGCPSMNYKANFRPHELLAGYVDDHENAIWSPSS